MKRLSIFRHPLKFKGLKYSIIKEAVDCNPEEPVNDIIPIVVGAVLGNVTNERHLNQGCDQDPDPENLSFNFLYVLGSFNNWIRIQSEFPKPDPDSIRISTTEFATLTRITFIEVKRSSRVLSLDVKNIEWLLSKNSKWK